MDVVASAAAAVVRQSTSVLQAAADELAKQDPIGWLAAEADFAAEYCEEERPPHLVAVPLVALQPWGLGWGSGRHVEGYGSSLPSRRASPYVGMDSDLLGGQVPASSSSRRAPPFAVDFDLNGKVILWEGNPCCLEVDALLAPAAAGFAAGASTIFDSVLRYGGKELREELQHLDPCRSGEARITKAYNLPARWLLITVGPKYKEKYQTAAQNTLNSCYRECMQLLAECRHRTVGVPCVWYHKGYPPEEQAHIALRTVRKCLEKFRTKVDAVVFAAADPVEAKLYHDLLPYYFPRNAEEAREAARVLPECAWSEWGEVSVEERRIRVAAHLRSSSQDGGDGESPLFSQGDDMDRTFLDARDDADTVARLRLEGTMIEAENLDLARHACLRYLRRAREIKAEHDLPRFVYRAGKDRFARWVVVLLGARIPSLGIRDERTLPLFVKELEPLYGEKFVLLYVNSGVAGMDTSNLEVLHEMLAVISARYRSCLDQLLVLHPGLWFRAAFALGWAVNDLAASVWHDTVYLEGLADLAAMVALEQLALPEYVHAAELAEG